MPAPFTQLAPAAIPGRRYGSFAGRIPVAEAAAPVWVHTDRRMGRFGELLIPVRYLDPITISLPQLWDVVANDYMVTDVPIDILVQIAPIMVAVADWHGATGGVSLIIMGETPVIGRTLDRISAGELVTLGVRPFKTEALDLFIAGPLRQRILEAQRLLGFSIE